MGNKFENQENADFSVTLFNIDDTSWEEVESDIMELDHLCFGDDMDNIEWRRIFEDAHSVIVFLKKGKRIVGFTCGIPSADDGTLNVETTEIHPDYQGQGHVAALNTQLEAEAKARGYQYLSRDSLVENGYADTISKNYAGRIVATHEHDSPYGPQRYFKISLNQ